MPRRYRAVLNPAATNRRWLVEGESLVDPDAWVDVQRFSDREEAQRYITEVVARQQDQERLDVP